MLRKFVCTIVCARSFTKDHSSSINLLTAWKRMLRGAGAIQRALVPRYDTAAMYIGILEKHRLFTPLHSKRPAKAPSRFFWLAPKPRTCSLTMGVVLGSCHESLCSFSQQQHGRRYRAQGGISSGTQVGLVRQLYQCHEVSAGVYETPL